MREKKEILKIAVDAMKKCTDFENKVKRELNLYINEVQPSMSVGELFDCVVEMTLNEQGQDILYSFVFPIMTEYDEDNPFEIEVDDKTIEIRNNEELVNFFDEYGYFLK